MLALLWGTAEGDGVYVSMSGSAREMSAIGFIPLKGCQISQLSAPHENCWMPIQEVDGLPQRGNSPTFSAKRGKPFALKWERGLAEEPSRHFSVQSWRPSAP